MLSSSLNLLLFIGIIHDARRNGMNSVRRRTP
jgi:hypothetical protein